MLGQKLFLWTMVGVVAIFVGILWINTSKEIPNNKLVQDVTPMTLTSSAFVGGGNIPEIYTCDGVNISPPLEFTNVPQEAKSLALVINDSDVPAGNWVHWVVWNIPPRTIGFHAGEKIVAGVEGLTSFGRNGYGGPCPPDGVHRYIFTLYALDYTLNLQPVFGVRLEKTIASHIIQKAELIGKYTREGE